MRLLKRERSGWFSGAQDFSLTEFDPQKIPEYAILSHRWGLNEVTFKDIENGTGKTKNGYKKLEFCAEQADNDGLMYFWIDTCCIDKTSSAELSEAINSMFKWYRNATKCYVYLADVISGREWESAFQRSEWFDRGWTLQELIAPIAVEFFSLDGVRLGDRISLEQQISQITGISIETLRGKSLCLIGPQERFSWTIRRRTTIEEDTAYCLLGIFDIHMPLLYGEGQQKALARLWKKINRSSLADPPDPTHVEPNFTTYQFVNGTFRTSSRTQTLSGSLYAQILQRQIHDLLPLINDEVASLFEQKYHAMLSSQLDRVDAMVSKALNDFIKDDHTHLLRDFDDPYHTKNHPDILPIKEIGYTDPEFNTENNSKRLNDIHHYGLRTRKSSAVLYKRRWVFRWRLGSFSITITRRRTLHGSKLQDFEAHLHFRPVQEFLSKGLSISYNCQYDARGNRRISPTLLSFNVIPVDSEILVASARGDILRIKELFTLNCASPTDEDLKGRNALYFAARNGHSDLCRYLVGQGMPLSSVEGALYGAHRYMFQLLDGDVPYSAKTGLERYISICRTLESAECYVADTDTNYLRMWLRGEEFLSPVRQYHLRRDQVELSRRWFAFLKDVGLPIHDDDESVFCWMQAVCWSCDPALIQMFLLNGGSVSCTHTEKTSLFQLVFSGACLGRRSDIELELCLFVLLVHGCNPNQRDTEGKTPNFVAYVYGKTEVWVSALQRAGVNMTQFLEIEGEEFGTSSVVECSAPPADGLRKRCAHNHDDE